MSGRDISKSENGGEEQRIPPTPPPAASTLFVPPTQPSEADSLQSSRTLHEEVLEPLASPARVSSTSASGNANLVDTGRPMDSCSPPPMVDQSGISDFANPTISQGSQNEEEHLVQTEDGSYEQEATRSSSPESSLSQADNRSETDATDYDEGDRPRGMDAYDSLPPLSDEDKATWARGSGGR